MIYCFSGTGNSRYVAGHIAQLTGEELADIGSSAPDIGPSTTILGLIFPVYGWHMPRIVEHFIRQIEHRDSLPKDIYTFAVLTCGDDIGHTHHLLRRALARRGLRLNAVFSVIMPNTYVSLPGFDIDPPVLQQEKMRQCVERISEISSIVRHKREVTDVHPGAFAWLKTYVLGCLFRSFLMSDRRFRTTKGCVGCRKCEAVCPARNIKADKQGHPVWQGHCTMCLACYHNCPTHSIEYGAFTKGKGQYICKLQ